MGFVVGFFWYFMGLYLLGVPSIASLIGWGELGYLTAAALIATSNRATTSR